MRIFITIFALALSTYFTPNSAQYILCIDGGGSKTSLQVTDMQGNILPLTKDGQTFDTFESSGSNVTTLGYNGVKESLRNLFEGATLNGKSIVDMLTTSYVIAGMAGCGSSDNKHLVSTIFEELGIQKNRLLLTTDAALALHLVPGDGAILIAGTGSICLGKKDGKLYRSGGLGPLLGDEGSGYYIGRKALKASLAEEYGYGSEVSWTPALRELYKTLQLKSIVSSLRPPQIAHATHLLIEKAQEHDVQACAIVSKAAEHLRSLVAAVIKHSDVYDAQVHLWGGLFKSVKKIDFIDKIESDPLIQEHRITLINQANCNAATLFVQQQIPKNSELDEHSWQEAQKLFAS